jgi:hypothetical protein
LPPRVAFLLTDRLRCCCWYTHLDPSRRVGGPATVRPSTRPI